MEFLVLSEHIPIGTQQNLKIRNTENKIIITGYKFGPNKNNARNTSSNHYEGLQNYDWRQSVAKQKSEFFWVLKADMPK